jgi:hypothetical protein
LPFTNDTAIHMDENFWHEAVGWGVMLFVVASKKKKKNWGGRPVRTFCSNKRARA